LFKQRTKPGPSTSRRAELHARRTRLTSELRAVSRQLGRLDPEPGTVEAAAAIREREALRRKRMRLLLAVDRVNAAIERAKPLPGHGKRVVQGPRQGVTSVVQGGSPGLGRRA
jgi:hypothetical protein